MREKLSTKELAEMPENLSHSRNVLVKRSDPRIITKLPIVASRSQTSPCFIMRLFFFLSFCSRQLMAEVLTMGTFWKREVELLKFLLTIFFQEKLQKLKMLVCKWFTLISKESQRFKFVLISFFAVIVAVIFFFFSFFIFNFFLPLSLLAQLQVLGEQVK